MNTRVIGLGLAVLLAMMGCQTLGDSFTREPQTISIPLQDARNVYARVSTVYKDLAEVAANKCARKQLKVSECDALAQLNEQARTLDFQIRAKIDNPRAELDTEKVIKVLEIVAGIVGKLA